jgi:hypothetical protein
MKKKADNRNFEQVVDLLRGQGFDVTPSAAAEGAVEVSKHGAGAILAPGERGGAAAVAVVGSGALVNGQVSRLLDRGYQKFIHTAQFELPATAAQLHAIHLFDEELKQLIGTADLFNEGLGTTSDLYQYDRLKGREAAQPAPVRPWDHAGSH